MRVELKEFSVDALKERVSVDGRRLITPAVALFIPVSLDEVSSSGSGSGSDQRALFAVDQSASDDSGGTSNKRALSSAMVIPAAVATLLLRVSIYAAKCPEQQSDAQTCSDHAFVRTNSFHSLLPLFLSSALGLSAPALTMSHQSWASF